MPTAGQIITTVAVVQEVCDETLEIIKEFRPEVALPAEIAEKAVDALASLASKALTAWSNAANVPITQESITQLMPDPTPLSEPDPPAL